MDAELDRNAILALLVRRERNIWKQKEQQRISEEATKAAKEAANQVQAVNAALKDLFGLDVADDKIFAKIKRDYGAQVSTYAPEKDTTELPALPKPQISEPTPPPPINQLVLDRLKEAGKTGSKAAPIRKWIEGTHGLKVHEKTVGMTLYRLLKKGRVRRDRHTWFFVPETKNPGGDAPGLGDLLK